MSPWAGFPLTDDGAVTPGHGPDGVLPVSVPEASEVVSDPAPSSLPLDVMSEAFFHTEFSAGLAEHEFAGERAGEGYRLAGIALTALEGAGYALLKNDDGAATPPAEGTGVGALAAAESATGGVNTDAAPSSPLLFELVRTRDISGVSGTGVVADGAQWADGSVAVRWRGDHPATAVWPSIADVLAVHGHHGATTVRWLDQPAKLARAYERVTDWLLSARCADRPTNVAAHPVYGDRLLLTFTTDRVWRFWIALFDGSTLAAIHEQTGAGTEHRWVSPDGLLWLSLTDPTNNA